MVADLLVSARASQVLTMTLHSSQVHGFFSVPVDHLHALRELAGHFRDHDLSESIVRVPGPGQRQERGRVRPPCWGCPWRPGRRSASTTTGGHHSSSVTWTDCDVIVLDDEIAKGTTFSSCWPGCANARSSRARGVHAWAVRRRCLGIRRRARGRRDRLYQHAAAARPRTEKLPSLRPGLAEAMRRIHIGESVSALFGQH